MWANKLSDGPFPSPPKAEKSIWMLIRVERESQQ
jgi:hypothetical protein